MKVSVWCIDIGFDKQEEKKNLETTYCRLKSVNIKESIEFIIIIIHLLCFMLRREEGKKTRHTNEC